MDMDVCRHMDAYLRRHPNLKAPESQPGYFPTPTMDLFPSESMVLEDIDLSIDIMDASFPSESTILEDIDVHIVDVSFSSGTMQNSDTDVVDVSLFSRDHPVSSMSRFPSQFPSNMTYTPEYIPGPTISNFARSSHAAWCELPSLPTIPISKSK